MLNAYVWRGQVVNDKAVLQPAVTAARGAFSINSWGNFNLTDNVTDDSADFSEIDLTVAYSKTLGIFGAGMGYIEYAFPNTAAAATREVYLSCSLQALPVVPALTVYYDFNEADGFYGNFSMTYGYKFCDSVSASIFTSLGAGCADYNNFYFGIDDAALNDLNIGCSFAIKISDSLLLSPAVQYTALMDGEIDDASGELYKNNSQLAASLKASYSF